MGIFWSRNNTRSANDYLDEQLKRENDSLREINRKLESSLITEEIERLEGLETSIPLRNTSTNSVSPQKISFFVEQLLQNEEINIKYFPDPIERQLYRNVFKMALELVNKVISESKIEFMGHVITLHMEPIVEN